MDFLDNAFEKAKEVFDVACKKTNEVVTTQKQKFDIASIENKRNKDFLNLGRLYFEAVKDAEIEDIRIKNLIDSIKEKNELIDSINDEIINTLIELAKIPSYEGIFLYFSTLKP